MTATPPSDLRTWQITVVGAPRTKKTHNRIIRNKGRIMVLPSKEWTWWCENAQFKMEWDPRVYPIESLVSIEALFYRQADVGDASGYYQGLADLLEKRKILKNDKQIKHWDGTRMLKDKDSPRVEVTIHELVRVDKQLNLLEGPR